MGASTNWGEDGWGDGTWGVANDFDALLDVKNGNEPHFRLLWHLDAGDQDITQYYISGGSFAQEKERPPARLTAGDTTLIMDNTSGKFSEDSASSFLNGVNYHNRKISLEVGLRVQDGTVQYFKVATMVVSDVTFASDNNEVSIHMYDAIGGLMAAVINQTPTGQSIPTYGAGNVGNGKITAVATKPFKTKTETWTITCTTPGGGGVALFSVVGSVSGNVGTATDGTEFANGTTGGVRFTVQAGTVNWSAADTIVFTTAQMMEWTAYNPVKILWSILTGYNWDTNVADPWLARSGLLDHTQSDLNVDLDYPVWAAAITSASSYFTLTGFIPWDYNLADAIEEINALFLGAFPVDALGRLSVKIFIPAIGVSPRNFADTKKTSAFNYVRDTRDALNQVTIKYRKTTDWPWSDDDQVQTLDGTYVSKNATSITALKQVYAQDFTTRWYNATDDHVVFFATRILDKYGRVPRRFTLTTGIDGLKQMIGDIISVTDAKLLLSLYEVEVMKKELNTDQLPIKIMFTAEDTGTFGIGWPYLGSSANEGDGMSPQSASFDTASASDKLFCYLSTTGGSGLVGGPDRYLF